MRRFIANIKTHNKSPLLRYCAHPIRNYVSNLSIKEDSNGKIIPNTTHKIYQIVAQNNKSTLLKNLLNFGIDPNSTEPNELSLLDIAVKNGCEENVKLLLSHGANINMALHNAAISTIPNSIEIIDILLKAGADPNKTYSNFTPLDKIVFNIWSHYYNDFIHYNRDIDENAIRKLTLARSHLLNVTNYTPHLLESAVKMGDFNWVTEIVDTKKIALYPKLLECAYYRLSMTKSLLATKNSTSTRLITATTSVATRLPIIITSLKVGLNPNHDGLLPLHAHSKLDGNLSELKNYNDILNEYIKYGTKLNTVNECGQTALMIASGAEQWDEHPIGVAGNVKAVKILLDAGCDKHIKCKNGMTAMDYAIHMYNPDNNRYTICESQTKRDALETYEKIIYLLK